MRSKPVYYQKFLFWLLHVFHFLFEMKDNFLSWTEKKINERLEGEVVYYAFYSKNEKFFGCLYDHRSYWQRFCMAFLSVLKPYNAFTITDVVNNIPNLFDYVDVAIVVYAKNGKLEKKLLTKYCYEHGSQKGVFGYAVVEDENGNNVDLTTEVNEFGVCQSLTCGEVTKIFVKLLKNKDFDTNKIKGFKCMTIATFTDELLKEEDNVLGNDRKQ